MRVLGIFENEIGAGFAIAARRIGDRQMPIKCDDMLFYGLVMEDIGLLHLAQWKNPRGWGCAEAKGYVLVNAIYLARAATTA